MQPGAGFSSSTRPKSSREGAFDALDGFLQDVHGTGERQAQVARCAERRARHAGDVCLLEKQLNQLDRQADASTASRLTSSLWNTLILLVRTLVAQINMLMQSQRLISSKST